MYKCVLNSVVKISRMFAKYFEYYTIILGGGRFFVHTLYNQIQSLWVSLTITFNLYSCN